MLKMLHFISSIIDKIGWKQILFHKSKCELLVVISRRVARGFVRSYWNYAWLCNVTMSAEFLYGWIGNEGCICKGVGDWIPTCGSE